MNCPELKNWGLYVTQCHVIPNDVVSKLLKMSANKQPRFISTWGSYIRTVVKLQQFVTSFACISHTNSIADPGENPTLWNFVHIPFDKRERRSTAISLPGCGPLINQHASQFLNQPNNCFTQGTSCPEQAVQGQWNCG